jgi:phosphatidylinositol glycan class B
VRRDGAVLPAGALAPVVAEAQSVTAFVRRHLAVTLGVTIVTSWFSYSYFHIDEYFQVLELVRFKLGDIGEPLPWEHVERLRPWLQPFLYWCVGRVFGLHDAFRLAFACRLATGLANVGALTLLLRTLLPWQPDDATRRMLVRVMTLCGFFPYLFVRTSSEAASMAALTAGFAIALHGATPGWTIVADARRMALAGFVLGCAFEFRFQTAFASLGIVAWLGWHSRRALLPIVAGAFAALIVAAFVDRWGYGSWQFPPWTYFKANILEGAAGQFGREWPFAYLWLSPANVFLPVVALLMIVAAVAWRRAPWHPLTAATMPFVVIHCLIAHKEERFLFPVAMLLVALTPLGWRLPRLLTRIVATWSTAMMVLLAFVPLGWHTHVRFARAVHDRVGDELHAVATPEINLNLPPFRPRVYDLQKADPATIARSVDEHTAREWLVTGDPVLPPELAGRATLEFSELPWLGLMPYVESWNRSSPFGPIHYRTLWRLAR